MGSLGGYLSRVFVGKIIDLSIFSRRFQKTYIEVMMHCMVWHKEIRTPGGNLEKLLDRVKVAS